MRNEKEKAVYLTEIKVANAVNNIFDGLACGALSWLEVADMLRFDLKETKEFRKQYPNEWNMILEIRDISTVLQSYTLTFQEKIESLTNRISEMLQAEQSKDIELESDDLI